jgi:hypothetical protein
MTMRVRSLSLTLGLAGLGLFATVLSSASCGARSSLDIPPPAPPLPKCVVDADCDGFADKCRHVHCVYDEGSGGSGATTSSSASSSSSGAGGGGTCDECSRTGKGCGNTGGAGGGGTASSSSTSAGGGAFGSSGTGASQGLSLANGHCIETAPTNCDDQNPCTKDACVPETGACTYTPATKDLDGDGYNGPLEGHKAGDCGSCGDDCDDTNKAAFPGNKEVCDGVDNDCNGVVDDNATFIPLSAEPVQVSEHATAAPGSIAWNGTSYFASYTETTSGQDGGADVLKAMLTPTGDKIPPGQEMVQPNFQADSFGGSVVWTGDRFGLAWEARYDGFYQIYFTELDDKGKVFLDMVKLSHTTNEFAINQDIGFTGQNFVVVWQDDRLGPFDLFGSVINLDGKPIKPDVKMTDTADTSFPNEAPSVAATSQGIGVAWSRGDTANHFIRFQLFDFDLKPTSDPIDFGTGSEGAVYPNVIFNGDRYIISWFEKNQTPAAVYAAAVDKQGHVLVPAKAVTSPGAHHSRYPFMRALGDRVLLVYADDRDQNQGYELYSHVFDNNLSSVSSELRLTNAPGDSIYPKAAFGKDGDVGVLFRDDRTGEQQVWFTRLGCVAGKTP